MRYALIVLAVLLAGQGRALAQSTPWATLTPLPTPNPAATTAVNIEFLQGANIQFAETIVQRYNQFNSSTTPGPLDTFMFLLLIMLIIAGIWSIQRRIARLR